MFNFIFSFKFHEEKQTFKKLAPKGTKIISIKFCKNLPTKKIAKTDLGVHTNKTIQELTAGRITSKFKYILNVEAFTEIDEESSYLISYEEYEDELEELWSNKNPITNKGIVMKYILLTASEGLMHFIDQHLAHRNISPNSIVVCKEDNHFVGKISDFTMSKPISDECFISLSSSYTSHELCSPPEKYNASKRSCNGKKFDVFSMGVVYFFAFTGMYPFKTKEEITNNVNPNYELLQTFHRLKHWDYYLAVQLISSMLQHSVSKRPTIKQVLNHPFFWDETKRENFLTTVSQYIQGKGPIRTRFNEKCNPIVENWKNDKAILEMIENSYTIPKDQTKDSKKVEEPYGDNASDFLKLIRNIVGNRNFF